jgi:hypothetical protein
MFLQNATEFSIVFTLGSWLSPQVVQIQWWWECDLCKWPWHSTGKGDWDNEVGYWFFVFWGTDILFRLEQDHLDNKNVIMK